MSHTKNFILFLLAAFYLCSNRANAAPTAEEVTVCAVPQMYGALKEIGENSKIKFNQTVDTISFIYAGISNNELKCNLVLSGFGQLPVVLIQSGKVMPTNVYAFARAPLVLAAKDRNLFRRDLKAITDKKLRSIAIPKADQSAVGYASSQIVKSAAFPTGYLQEHIYRADQEFQILSMVDNNHVQTGFVTLPLLKMLPNSKDYSYWYIPSKYYPEIFYYVMVMEGSTENQKVTDLMRYLMEDEGVMRILKEYGFEEVNETRDNSNFQLAGFFDKPKAAPAKKAAKKGRKTAKRSSKASKRKTSKSRKSSKSKRKKRT